MDRFEVWQVEVTRCRVLCREVATSSPTLPLGGYVGFRRMKEDATPIGLRLIGVAADSQFRYPRVARAATLGWRSQPLRGT